MKAYMVCLGLKPGAAGWKAQMNPLSYSGIPFRPFLLLEIIRTKFGAIFGQQTV